MSAADYARNGWGGGLLVCESAVQRTAPFGDGKGGASRVEHRGWSIEGGASRVEHWTMSRLGRHNRELQRREKLGTVWTEHNLLALLQEQGLSNQTT